MSDNAPTDNPPSSPPPPPPDATTCTSATTPPASPTGAGGGDLDPRIQIELENLNTATDNINRLEIELEEANATFRLLLNESTRRLKLLSKKLGTCIDKARPYHEAADRSRLAQIECQAAAVQFQRAHEHYAAAKETVALAEQRFMSGSHEWQFDNAWQEMLNHATLKVAAAEQHKSECNAEHQRCAAIFSAAEARTSQLEDQQRRNVIKSRPYFEEKQICQDQLQTQKDRIQELQQCVQQAKRQYSQALKALEQISEDIHRARATTNGGAAHGSGADTGAEEAASSDVPRGPREPGVGAEKCADDDDPWQIEESQLPSLNFARELDRCEVTSIASTSTKAARIDDDDDDENRAMGPAVQPSHHTDDATVEELRIHVKELAVRPVEGCDGQQSQDVWETELNDTVDRLDRLLMQREQERQIGGGSVVTDGGHKLQVTSAPPLSDVPVSMPNTPMRKAATAAEGGNAIATAGSLESPVRQPSPVRQLLKAEPLPAANVSMRELPLLQRLSNELTAVGNRLATQVGGSQKRRRSLE